MAYIEFFYGKFTLKIYKDLEDITNLARCLPTVEEFMLRVMQNAFENREGEQAMEQFCNFLNNEKENSI